MVCRLQHIGETLADIVRLLGYRVSERQFIVERHKAVGHLVQVALIPVPASALVALHRFDPDVMRAGVLKFNFLFVQFAVDDPLYVIFVLRPDVRFFVPDGVEVFSSHHQIAFFFALKVRVDIDAGLRLLHYNIIKVHVITPGLLSAVIVTHT